MDNVRSLASKAALLISDFSPKKDNKKIKGGRKNETTSKYFQECESSPRKFGTTMSNIDLTKFHKNRAEKYKRMICSEEVSRKKLKIGSKNFGQSSSETIGEDNDAFFDRLWRKRDEFVCNKKNFVKRRKPTIHKNKKNIFDSHTVKTISEFKVVMEQPNGNIAEEKSVESDTDEPTILEPIERNISTQQVDQENVLPETKSTINYGDFEKDGHWISSQRLNIGQPQMDDSFTSDDIFENYDLMDDEKILTPPGINHLYSQNDIQKSPFSDEEA